MFNLIYSTILPEEGCENIYTMTESTFKLVTDRDTDISYITRAEDEEIKNHKELDRSMDITSGYMPEMTGSKYCPVQSFLTYLYSLDLKVPFLWQ